MWLLFMGYPFIKTNYAMINSSEKYAISAAYGLAYINYLFITIFLQTIPSLILFFIYKKNYFIDFSIKIKIYLMAIIFIFSGTIVALVSRNSAYFVLPVTYFLDFIFISMWIIFETRKEFSCNYKIFQFIIILLIFTLSIAFYKFKYAEWIIEIIFDNTRFSCDKDYDSKLYNLYDNIADKEILPHISDGCIWYYPSIDTARVYKKDKLGLILVSENKYIYDPSALDIGVFSDGVFRIKTSFCDRFQSKYNDSHEILCKTGYLNPDGSWLIEPKYYLANDFKNGIAKVAIISKNNIEEIKYICINKEDEILKYLIYEEDCN